MIDEKDIKKTDGNVKADAPRNMQADGPKLNNEIDDTEEKIIDEMDEQEYRGKYRKLSIAVVIIVLLLFLIILYATDLVGEYLGKTGENIALGVVALVLAAMLIRTKKDK